MAGDWKPGINVSGPHFSEGSGMHRDVTFEQGRLPGQLPIPFGKIHEPVNNPVQMRIPGMGPNVEIPKR